MLNEAVTTDPISAVL